MSIKTSRQAMLLPIGFSLRASLRISFSKIEVDVVLLIIFFYYFENHSCENRTSSALVIKRVICRTTIGIGVEKFEGLQDSLT